MSMARSEATAKATAARPYRLFDAELLHKRMLSPHLCRLTFAGGREAGMHCCAPDQRIKVFFPGADGKPPSLPLDDTWLTAYQAMPAETRPPRRTYTIRALRGNEIDIDFVLHGENGPASRWATHAKPGDRIQIVVPDGSYDGDPGGYEWRPPEGVKRVLLIADETALPAATGILEEIAAREDRPRVEAWYEVPAAEDCTGVPDFPELRLIWMPRGEKTPNGAQMIAAAEKAEVLPAAASVAASDLPDIDVDKGILWDRATAAANGFYVWVAGEGHAVKEIRRILLKERGVDRDAANLMGYWRDGGEME